MKRAPAPVRTADEILASEAATRLGLTNQAIGQWTIKPGAPVRKSGARVFVRWPEFARWREKELVSTAKKDSPVGSLAEKRAETDARLAAITLERAELSLALELGQAVALSDYNGAVATILDRLMARLRAMPVRLGHLGPDVEAALDKEVERIVVELHAWDEDVVEEEGETAETEEEA